MRPVTLWIHEPFYSCVNDSFLASGKQVFVCNRFSQCEIIRGHVFVVPGVAGSDREVWGLSIIMLSHSQAPITRGQHGGSLNEDWQKFQTFKELYSGPKSTR